MLKNKGFEYLAYYVNRLNNYCGQWLKYGGWYPDKKIRLFNKTKCQWGGINLHEQISFPKNEAVGWIKKDIYHLTYEDLSTHLNQINKFSTIASQEAFAKDKKVLFLVHIIFYPFFTFVKNYIFKRGFLDGKVGFIVAISAAYYRFSKYTKLYFLKRAKN